MKFKIYPRAGARRDRAAFTLVEVLAAMVFMAIVIPVAVQGLRVATMAGVVAHRKASAVRIAERVLNEMVASGQLQAAGQNGTVQEGAEDYKWTLRSKPWTSDLLTQMSLVTVQVTYPVQGSEHEVHISTLVSLITQ